MRLPSDFRPIKFHQTCAIARMVLLRDATVTNAEWKEAVKDVCARQGYLAPELDMLDRAMRAVEHSLLQTMGRRPVKELGPPPDEPKTEAPPLTPAEWAVFAATIQRVHERSAAVGMPANVRTIAKETLEVSEHAALDQFYSEAETDRVGALQRFAEVAIARPAEWDPAQIRAESRCAPGPVCFACGAHRRAMVSHHVIQVQHGGSNGPRNKVTLCEPCHSAVHPWLPKVARTPRSGWSGFVDVAPALFALIEQWHTRRKDAS